ncbi:Trp family transcriptional regulator [Entomospira entomophila]|uniref:Transcriptional regulator n=1 Tax=Entomospira entomophila TaxID=2719988 RepID=A0A968KT51_9SPIO|nr:Trp family transcriptional regulator [Entomospira entomophilus]NIZ39916.1 transcriptional regulator [Entomospira entomophilus]WDI35478.1 Trp family transcriptional regulator [Entomospira entomophilus]
MDEKHIENNFREFVHIMQKLPPIEVYTLIRQILTEKEFSDISKRWDIAKMLYSGTTQRQVAADLHVSLCKITRGSRELKRPNSVIKKAVTMHFELQKEQEQSES